MTAVAQQADVRLLEREENLLARLDRLPITRSVWLIIGMLMLVWMVEAFDIGIIGASVLFLRQDWNLTAGQTGLLGSAGTFGIVLGLLPAGRLADKYGRKSMLLIGIAIFSVFTLASVLATNIYALAALRFIAGLGEGAVFPVPYLLIAEFVNKKRRGEAVGWANFVLTGAYMIPTLAGLWVVAAGFPVQIGWRVLYGIGGALILLVPLLWKWLPESPRFLLKRGRVDEVRVMVEQFEDEAGLPHDEQLMNERALRVLKQTAHKEWDLGALFRPPYLQRCLIAYAALGSPFVVFYLMTIYGPTIFHDMGANKSNSLLYIAALQLVSGFGTLFGAMMGDRFGRRPVHVVIMLVAALGLALLGLKLPTPLLIIVACAVWFFGLGAFAVPKLYMAEQFPTRLRATGSAAGEVVTRFAIGVVLVYFIPTLIASLAPEGLFVVLAVAMALLVLPLAFFGIETAGKSVEETGTQLAA